MLSGFISENSSLKAATAIRCEGCVSSKDAHAAREPRNARLSGLRLTGSFGCDAAGRLAKTLEPLLDVSERLEAGFDGVGLDVLQNI
jgi:hypothetical protein